MYSSVSVPSATTFKPSIVGEHNNSPYDVAAFRVAVHLRNEGAADFQAVHWDPAQAAE
jgi:hypothetical protein